MGNYYDLVLLDSGYDLEQRKPNVDVYVEQGQTWKITPKERDEIGHGAAVLSIVLKGYKDCDGRFAVFKAFTSAVLSNIDGILSALNYIYSHVDCKIIQMSLGVRAYSTELYALCKKIHEDKSVIIVAAFDNSGAISYPAAFPFVVGVSGNPFIKTKHEFSVNLGNVLDIYAKSGMQIVASNNENGIAADQGNSFAASYVSLALLESKKLFSSKTEAMKTFYENYHVVKRVKEEGVLGTKTALFPLNKEMYSLINYADMLMVDLVDIYDIKYSSNIGRTLHNFNGTKKYTVRNIERCDWDSFDTLILGHQRELSLLLGRDTKKELLEKCIEHHKNVYCFDNLLVEEYRDRFTENHLVLECADSYTPTHKQGRLYQIKTPILCVFGTNKKQGKFTLQMQIKKILSDNGVDLGVLGTEPNALLLGCDSVLPIGYDSLLGMKTGEEIIEAVNDRIHEIDKMEKDLILVGGQSGFLPHITYNIGHINIAQMAFLYGVLPDGVILSFREDDDPDYLKRAISAIENLCGAKVFMLALYAFHTEKDYVIDVSKRRLTDEEIASKKKSITEETGLPVVVSGDAREEKEIFRHIIKFYCDTDID
jgi:hypothetical protein